MSSILAIGIAVLAFVYQPVVSAAKAVVSVVKKIAVSVGTTINDALLAGLARMGGVMYMGAATGRDLHIDQVLSQMAIGYRPSGFIADMIFPTVPVAKQTDKYLVFDRGDRMRIESTVRAPGTMARRVSESVGSATYYANNYALAAAAILEDKVNADPAFVAGVINGKATFLLDKLLLDWENRVALMCTSGSNVGSSAAVSSGWSGSGADPLANINTAIDNVSDSNGVRPNRVVMGLQAWRSFRRNSTVRNLIFGTNNGGGYPTVQQVAQLLDVEEVLVGGAYQNTAQEGQSETLATIWNDNVLVYYAPQTPAIDRPSFGYNFRWSAPGLPNMQVERHPFDSKTKSEDIEVGYYQDEKITGASYAFLLKAVNSST